MGNSRGTGRYLGTSATIGSRPGNVLSRSGMNATSRAGSLRGMASMLAAQPLARIHRLAVLAHLEVFAGIDSRWRTGGGDHHASRDLGAYFVQQRLVVAVHAHPALAVVDDEQQAIAPQEARIDDLAGRHGTHFAAPRGLDQHAVAIAVHGAVGRPGQVAANIGAAHVARPGSRARL